MKKPGELITKNGSVKDSDLCIECKTRMKWKLFYKARYLKAKSKKNKDMN